ncbi:unnamed protein product [Adineta steineri]|uniref:Uncharacterized protein n=1 Tax=Adineta steineri TaxID=433720 RepID=A0A819UHQ5_9BILA|nr:unnamed protein product [Adineta steineri]CAF4080311.1 unnamed protein product [Adineta steineri]CAF4080325.1 unnamed protein product [Adineta steineri]
MPLIIANKLTFIEEEVISLNLDTVVNSNPVTTIGSRLYDIIYTSSHYNAPHLYAFEYNGNEKALACLRKILALQPDSNETMALFITKYKEPIDEENVKEYAVQLGSNFWNSYSEGQQETDQTAIHFHLIHGKIPENYGSLKDNDSESNVPPHILIDQLAKSVQPWL